MNNRLIAAFLLGTAALALGPVACKQAESPTTETVASTGTALGIQAAIDAARQDTERKAFEKLVERIETMWTGVVTQLGPDVAGKSATRG